LLSGEIQVIFAPPTVVLPHVRSGKMRAVAFTGPKRWWGLPNVPTVAEAAIPGFDVSGSWHAWFAGGKPSNTIITRLYDAIREAIQAPKVRDFIRTSGYEPDGRPPAEFQRFIAAEVQRYAEVVRKAGIEPQ
jgi:tripartite-type tricarboxylate transporter receptor subunit TctC